MSCQIKEDFSAAIERASAEDLSGSVVMVVVMPVIGSLVEIKRALPVVVSPSEATYSAAPPMTDSINDRGESRLSVSAALLCKAVIILA